MANKYVNNDGLSYFWGKIKAALAKKAPSTNGVSADRATADANGNNISSTYVTKTELQNALDALNLGFCNDETDMIP